MSKSTLCALVVLIAALILPGSFGSRVNALELVEVSTHFIEVPRGFVWSRYNQAGGNALSAPIPPFRTRRHLHTRMGRTAADGRGQPGLLHLRCGLHSTVL